MLNLTRISYSLLLLTILLMFTSCNIYKTKDINTKKIQLEIRNMLINYHIDIKKNGLLAEFKYLDNSPNFYWIPPNYKSALSIDSVKNILTGNDKMYTHTEFNWQHLKIIPLSKTTANFHGIVHGIITDTLHRTNHVLLIESGTLIKRLDGWKLLNGHTSILPNIKK